MMGPTLLPCPAALRRDRELDIILGLSEPVRVTGLLLHFPCCPRGLLLLKGYRPALWAVSTKSERLFLSF